MIAELATFQVNAVYACAAGMGAVVVACATNYVDLATDYEGGIAVTNHHVITVDSGPRPATEFSVDCQKVFFLNDADILAPGNCPFS